MSHLKHLECHCDKTFDNTLLFVVKLVELKPDRFLYILNE